MKQIIQLTAATRTQPKQPSFQNYLVLVPQASGLGLEQWSTAHSYGDREATDQHHYGEV